jgi:hypothetical protein
MNKEAREDKDYQLKIPDEGDVGNAPSEFRQKSIL